MAKTIIGTFGEVYHHIDAPTLIDEKYREETKKWGRIIEPAGIADWESITAFYLRNSYWTGKRKYDGTNIRIKWDGEQAIVAGKSNNANMQSYEGLQEYIDEHFPEEMFEEVFGRDKEVYIFGEWMGPKVQTNELGLDKPELVVFDVKINGSFISNLTIPILADRFNVPDYTFKQEGDIGDFAPKTLQAWIDDIAEGKFKDWEGVVVEPLGQFRDKAGHRIIYKIKNRDYYRG